MASRARERHALAVLSLLASCSGSDISLGEGSVRGRPEPDPLGEFAEPSAIAGLDPGDEEADDDDPALSDDLLQLYFNSDRAGGQGEEDIWLAERARASDPFSAPAPEQALNSEARETGIALSADGLRLWFSSDREGGEGGLDIYVASRASRREPWSVERAAELSSEGDDLVSSLARDELSLFLARRPGEDDDYDLFIARRAAPERAFAEPEPIAALNSDDEESDAVWLGEGVGLVFTRDEQLVRAPGYPSTDEVVALAALNSDDDDRDAWFARDLRYVVFSSDRSGSYRLYEARLR